MPVGVEMPAKGPKEAVKAHARPARRALDEYLLVENICFPFLGRAGHYAKCCDRTQLGSGVKVLPVAERGAPSRRVDKSTDEEECAHDGREKEA